MQFESGASGLHCLLKSEGHGAHLYETRRAVEAVTLLYARVACQVDCLTSPGPERM